MIGPMKFVEVDHPLNNSQRDPACQDCGGPLVYAGRGPRPKFCDDCKPQRAQRNTLGRPPKAGTVELAVNILQGYYDTLVLPLMLVSPKAAKQWQESVPKLQENNKRILAGDPDLVASICKVGQKSAKPAFVIAHLSALLPVTMTLTAEFKTRRAEKQTQEDEQDTVIEFPQPKTFSG